MCASEDTIIHQTNNGYVLQCTCCDDYQIMFGNMLLTLDYDDLLLFKQRIDNINFSCHCMRNPYKRQIALRVLNNTAFVLSMNEVIELKELLTVTNTSIKLLREVNNILNN